MQGKVYSDSSLFYKYGNDTKEGSQHSKVCHTSFCKEHVDGIQILDVGEKPQTGKPTQSSRD